MKTSVTVALAIATALSGPLAASAQTEPPAAHHHDHHGHPPHAVHHRDVAHGPVVTSERAGVAIEGALPQPNRMFQPYAQPGEGDSDGLSSDPDDCMKGCIGGNPQ